MIRHPYKTVTIARLIFLGKISFAGNRLLKIYGKLDCKSGRRMKNVNRVFFASHTEAIQNGFRPCGHCMANAYRKWKSSQEAG